MTKLDDKALCQEALDLVTSTGSAAAAELVSGISQRTLRDRVDRATNRHGLSPKKAAKAAPAAVAATVRVVEPAELLAADRKIKAVKDDVKEIKDKLKVSEAENEAAQKRLALLLDIDDKPSRSYNIPKYTTPGGKGVFVGVASDWHVEEDVSPKSIPGYSNKYNPDIAKQRAEKFFQSYVFMLDSWRHVGACDTAVLAILGDIITGYIHDELKESNHMSPSQAVLLGQELLGAGIEYILSHGKVKKLVLPCCYGNHGRTTLKSQIQTGAENSFEWLLYHTMKREWKAETRLEWHIADSYHNPVEFFGTRVRFHHGDSINYGGGVGGISVPVRKKIQAWNQNNANPAHIDVFGHFHQLMDGGNFICNGSLIGYNAYALSIGAAYERPRQACFWIDSQRGKTMFGELYCE